LPLNACGAVVPCMNLFAYGTLMFPEVWARAAREECASRSAELHGYEARRLSGVTFPGLIEAPGIITPGLVYLNVSPEAMVRLDAYEDDFYDRIPVTVELENGQTMEAQVYLISPEHRFMVLPERWQPPQ
jgi:gamma-glutamylcyclotransferase (GGCT)/AIG2-like uncharacterized protein YtfP